MNAIEIKNLSKAYNGFTLNNISLEVPSGSIIGLVGENGAGKSTTINLIMNTISRDSGSVKILGTDNQDPSFKNIKQDIGVVLDESHFPEMINAKNVNSIMKNTYTKWDESIYFNYLEKFKLPLNKIFKEFSRGMKMKLSIAVALSHDPKLLILDEATSGLDPIVRDEILDIFNDFTRQDDHSILLSSHIVSDLEKICDYIAFIHKGNLVFCEEKDLLLEQYAILKVSKSELDDIPTEAVKRKKENPFGYDLLIYKDLVSNAFKTEHTTLEDIILFFAKEEF